MLCAGFARTGTFTVHKALDILGFGPCWHGMRVLGGPKNITEDMNDFWLDVYNKRRENEIEGINWDNLFEKYGYQSAADFPPCDFWKEMDSFYSNHKSKGNYDGFKVILTLREEKSWYKSVLNSIYPHVYESSWKTMFLYYFNKSFNKQYKVWVEMADYNWNGWKYFVSNKQGVIDSYNKRNNDIIEYFKQHQDKLLIYDVKDGWEKLCTFLNVEIPNEPFPHQNKRGEFDEKENKYKDDGLRKVKIVIGIVGCVSVGILLYMIRNR